MSSHKPGSPLEGWDNCCQRHQNFGLSDVQHTKIENEAMPSVFLQDEGVWGVEASSRVVMWDMVFVPLEEDSVCFLLENVLMERVPKGDLGRGKRGLMWQE